MIVRFFMLVTLVFGVVLLPSFLATPFANRPGGSGWCDVNPYQEECEGSYIGSTGCESETVTQFATFGWADSKKSQSPGVKNCNGFFDSMGVACRSKLEKRILKGYACWGHWLHL